MKEIFPPSWSIWAVLPQTAPRQLHAALKGSFKAARITGMAMVG